MVKQLRGLACIGLAVLLAACGDGEAAIDSAPVTAGTEVAGDGQVAAADEAPSPPAEMETETTPDPATDSVGTPDPPAGSTAFAGGPPDLPRTFRYGFLEVAIVSATGDGATTTIGLEVRNLSEAELSGLRPELFRILTDDGTLVELGLASGERDFDVAGRGSTPVELTAAAEVDLATAALQMDNRSDEPSIIGFGGPVPDPAYPKALEAGQRGASEIDPNCLDAESLPLETEVTSASVEIDQSGPSAILSFGLGRADTDTRFLRLELLITQLGSCRKEVTLRDGMVTVDNTLEVSMTAVELVEGQAVPATVWITYPRGVEAVEFTLGQGDPITVAVAE